MNLLALVMSGFAAALLAPLLHRMTGKTSGWILAGLPAGLFIYILKNSQEIIHNDAVIRTSTPWLGSMGINASFLLDGLSLLFCLLITGIGSLVFIYASAYLKGDRHLGRFYAVLLAFMASMLGVVLSDNIITLIVFWELTSLSSYFLIGTHHEEAPSRAAALQALLVTGSGGLALLAGLLMMSGLGGSMELSVLAGQADTIKENSLYLPILILVLAGAFTKSAQVPFHFWLPNAMQAPTPVSAYLHSATMVKAGIYLLARLSPHLGGTPEWIWSLTLFGGATMLTGALLTVFQKDLKAILAYSTISALGMLCFLLGLGTPTALRAFVCLTLAHAFYKGTLFMVVGALDHGTGTRRADQMSGLAGAMPLTLAGAALAGLSMAGIPPFFGFTAKELVLEAALHSPRSALVLTFAAWFTSCFFVAVAFLVALGPFAGRRAKTPKDPHQPALGLWLGPLVLGLLGLAFGLIPALGHGPFIEAPLNILLASESAPPLAAEGFPMPLLLSGLALAVGFLLFAKRKFFWNIGLSSRLKVLEILKPSQWYAAGLRALNATAQFQTRVLQNGSLRIYLLVVISLTLGLAGYTFLDRQTAEPFGSMSGIKFHEWVLSLLMILAGFYAATARSLLAAVAAMGVIGYGVAIFYILFGAPDLAMTQFLVETLTLIIFLLVFFHLPGFSDLTSRASQMRDAVLSVAVGVGVTVLLLATTAAPTASKLTPYFAKNSLALAHGHNIVNVILVDFRGFDTLGEITVLSVAGVGVLALLRFKARA